MVRDSFDDIFRGVGRVLTVFAHPDDMEIFCGGTVARLIDSGISVRTVCATDGGRGVRDKDVDPAAFAAQRVSEQCKAANALGVAEDQVFNLGLEDGGVEDTVENIGKIVWHIRQHRPDIVISHEPQQFVHGFDREAIWLNHRDHRKTAGLVFDAIYPYSRDRAFFPEHIEAGLSGHEVHNILFADAYMHPEAIGIEVSRYLPLKETAFRCFLDGGSITEEEVRGFMTEGRQDDGWYEVLGYWRDFH